MFRTIITDPFMDRSQPTVVTPTPMGRWRPSSGRRSPVAFASRASPWAGDGRCGLLPRRGAAVRSRHRPGQMSSWLVRMSLSHDGIESYVAPSDLPRPGESRLIKDSLPTSHDLQFRAFFRVVDFWDTTDYSLVVLKCHKSMWNRYLCAIF